MTTGSDLSVLHAILGFPITVFISFLLLKYHNADASPFGDNNIINLVFFIAILTYVATMVTEFKLRISNAECPKVISYISLLSAALALVSLVMIPFPYLGWFLFVIWIGFFVKLAIDSYQEVKQLLGNAYQHIGNKLLCREEIMNPSSATSSTSNPSSVISSTSNHSIICIRCEAKEEEIKNPSSATSTSNPSSVTGSTSNRSSPTNSASDYSICIPCEAKEEEIKNPLSATSSTSNHSLATSSTSN